MRLPHSGSSRPRSHSTSAVTSPSQAATLSINRIPVPHITVQVEVDGLEQPHGSNLQPQMHDLSLTRSLPTPTIHIMDESGSLSDKVTAHNPSRHKEQLEVVQVGEPKLQPTLEVFPEKGKNIQNVGVPSADLHYHPDSAYAGLQQRPSRREDRLSIASKASKLHPQDSYATSREMYTEEYPQGLHGHHPLRHQPSQAFSAKSAAPLDFHDLSAIYTVVASRRDSYDNLLWQCPTMALTAQSFLFSIALDGETTRVARIIAMLLSIVITTCSLQLFTRQLGAEQADRQWLISFERRHGVPFEDTAFGENWDRYTSKLPQSAGFVKVLALTGSFPLWRNSLFVFLGAAVTVLSISFIQPSLFEGGDGRKGIAV